MPISPGTVGATVFESGDINASLLVQNNTEGTPTLDSSYYTGSGPQTFDSPATQLEATYARNGSRSDFTDNQSGDAGSRFSSYLGFSDAGKYDFNYRVFPDDLGQDQNGHYMIININVQVNRDVNNPTARTGIGATDFGPANYTVTSELSRVDQLKGNNGILNLGTIFNMDTATNFAGFNLPRSTRKIKEAIALHMPTPTVYTHTNVYEEISLTAFGAQALKLGVTAIGKLIAGGITRSLESAASRGAASVVDATGNLIRKGSAVAGYPINPKIEVLFSHTTQRAFRMELLMAPKNQNESDTIKNIIDTLRFHAAPEIAGVLGTFPVFVPPAEFDITFYHRGQENTKIPRINTCALEQIEVDYAPSGVYSTFSNGHSVAIRLSLAFRELEILHKERVTQGF